MMFACSFCPQTRGRRWGVGVDPQSGRHLWVCDGCVKDRLMSRAQVVDMGAGNLDTVLLDSLLNLCGAEALIKLCHPDKHRDNEELANEITKWLLEVRKTQAPKEKHGKKRRKAV